MRLLRLLTPLLWDCTFGLAVSGWDSERRPPPYDAAIDKGGRGYYPVQKFTSSRVTGPYINFLQWSPECDDGSFYFITPRGWSVSQPGPMIIHEDGTLLWSEHFANEFGGQAYDLKVQQYRGENYLTFWLGDDRIRGHGAGHYYMLNASYDIVHTVGAADGKYADLHEFLITPEDTALLIAFEVIPANVKPFGRKFNDLWNQAVWDCVFQEVNIETGELIFQWRASEHVNMLQTYSNIDGADGGTQQDPFDWIHLNSVAKDEHGNYLVSARNLHAVIYIDGKTGEILWTLGGKVNIFMDVSDGHALNFAWQHDARFVPLDAFPKTYMPPPEQEGVSRRLLTLFDNAAVDWNYFYGLSYSRGLLLEVTYPTPGFVGNITEHSNSKPAWLDTRNGETMDPLSEHDAEKVANINGTNLSHTVRVIREFVNPKHVRSSTQGSMQLLPQEQGADSRTFVGYGLNAVMTKFSSNGTVLCDMHFGAETSWERGDVQSYRAFKFGWVGKPRRPPAIAVHNDVVHVSWNGATEVHSWLLQVSDDATPDNWTDVNRQRKEGFEVTLHIPPENRSRRHLRCVALDEEDNVCGNGVSNVIARGFLTTHVRQRLDASSVLAMKGFVMLLGSFSGLGILYLLLYRYLAWRHSRPSLGAS